MPQQTHLYFGVDLGKCRDYSAICAIEYSRQFQTYRNPITYAMDQEFDEPRWAVRQLARIPLETAFTSVAEQVCAKIAKAAKTYDCTLVLDATGLGQPVVEMFQSLQPKATFVPVVITAAGSESRTPNEWHVPKQNLLASLQVMLETGQLQIANGLQFASVLLEEILEFRSGLTAKGNEYCERRRDDLALATAFAAWRARRHETPGPSKTGFQNKDLGIHGASVPPSGWGTRRLF